MDASRSELKATTQKIALAGKAGRWQEVLRSVEGLPHRQLRANAITFNAAIAAQGQCHQWQMALAFLEDMQSRAVGQEVASYSACITACGRASQPGIAELLFEELRALGPDLVAFSALLGAVAWARALALLAEIPEHRLVPNVFTYTAVMGAFARAKRWQDCLGLLSEMRSLGLAPNVVSFGSAISACEKAWRVALALLDGMEDLSVQRNVVTFNAAIAACASAGEWQQATAVLASMKGHRCIPNIISHSSAVSACEKCGDWVNALRHFDHLASANLTPSVVFCNAAVSACGKAREWQRALGLASSMGSLKLEQDTVTSGAVISALAEGSQWTQSLACLTAMGGGMDPACWCAAMSACERASHWQESLLLLEEMTSRRKGDEVSCTVAMSACKGNWQLALLVFADVVASKVVPSAANFGAAVAVCSEQGAWASALAMLENMLTLQLTPDPWVAGSTASALREACGAEAAWDVLNSVRGVWNEDGVCPEDQVPDAEVIQRGAGVVALSKVSGLRTEDLARKFSALVSGGCCLVSRLDYPTSGVLPLPLGPEGSLPARWLQCQFAARLVQKEYLCLCEGRPLGPVGTEGAIDCALETQELEELERQFSRTEVSEQGRYACTKYEVLARYRPPSLISGSGELMLMLARPLTGRTHQIRVHFASLGTPLVGDLTYGVRQRSLLPCQRLFLHCRRIALRDLMGEDFVAECPLPLDLREVLDGLLLVGNLTESEEEMRNGCSN
ncbi:unnamed protein product [Effrenium voratum]|uniref:Pseudouridine synthase RsuA/RluA-like domain-containing protein n=1 Tax=Effrenium voratum TaxID=2562239 RepID=A0AA36NFE5_9DINO|nr:unnamed protein product [Effrenium voratum]